MSKTKTEIWTIFFFLHLTFMVIIIGIKSKIFHKSVKTINATAIPRTFTGFHHYKMNTVMILSFRKGRSGQTVQTQITLLLEEQSDQGLHRLQYHLNRLDALLYNKAILFRF